MDLEAHLLDNIVDATTPPYETETAARSRREAIVQMVQAYGPSDAMEGMIVCHCVMLQYLLIGAMRDANNTSLDPVLLGRARSSAISISRTLHQWTTKFENTRKRSEARAAEAREAQAQAQAKSQARPQPEAQTQADTGATPGPAAHESPHVPAAPARPVLPMLVPNGRAAPPGNAPPAGSAVIAHGQPLSPASAERRPPT